jgi:3-deoxy-D-glycero-D-galacto-nononate 9-phosphate synthase
MTYIIGEIGQNHNGSVDIAKLIVELVSRPVREELFNIDLRPIDAIKLTKRDLSEELTKTQMNKIYDSPHSFGKTYGEHRAFLELSDEQHFEIYKHAKLKGLDVVETICARGALSLLKLFIPDKLKVASRDLTNLPLLQALAETKIPIILSTGMGGKKELDDAIDIITKKHSNIAILHCVSEYPTHPQNVNLNTIAYFLENYGKFAIGFSDHTVGISAPIAAIALGATIIEKHITIDRKMKGTDQAGSLGPDGVNRMIRDIRITEMSMGIKDIFISDSVQNSKIKLERSIASKCFIKKDELITEENIHMLSPGDGLKWIEKSIIIGMRAKSDIPKDEIIYKNMIY